MSIMKWNEFGERTAPAVPALSAWEQSVRQELWMTGDDNPGLSVPELDKLFELHADKQPARDPAFDFGADPEDVERIQEAIEAEIVAVADRMAQAYDQPIADWNVVDDDHVELLDKDDNVLLVITSKQLDGFYD